MTYDPVATDAITKVSQNLTAIVQLHGNLIEQAIHGGYVNLTMPGGEAMVALAPVSNFEAWTNMQETSERTGRPLTAPELEDENETPLQRLVYWSERWRQHHEAEYYGQTPTIVTEVNFLRFNLDWAIRHEPDWNRFVDDVHKARTRMETILHDGQRDIVSDDVTCLLCETQLRRRMVDGIGYEDEWWCKKCHLHLTPAQFNLAASESARRSIGLV